MIHKTIVLLACCAIQLSHCIWVFGQSQAAKFDVPAMLEAFPIVNDCILETDDPYETLIEIVVPVSCWVEPSYREALNEFRFDVGWNGNHYPVVDYAPRTLMQSPINGLIAVENRNDHSTKVGGNTSVPTPQVTVSANAETTAVTGTTKRFEEIPQQELLVASGSVNRGTGAFFRFHASKQFSLEGGRELRIIYRVPRSWRSGLVKVDCKAHGTIKHFASVEEIDNRVSFTVPIYIKGDHEARQLAVNYVQREQSFRAAWTSYLNNKPEPSMLSAIQASFKKERQDKIPDSWAVQIIQSPVDIDLTENTQRLPQDVRVAAKEFVDVRRSLVALANNALPDSR